MDGYEYNFSFQLYDMNARKLSHDKELLIKCNVLLFAYAKTLTSFHCSDFIRKICAYFDIEIMGMVVKITPKQVRTAETSEQ